MSSTTAGKPLSGKVALVTGASRGIGAACARALAGAGASVVMIARDKAAMDALARELPGSGHRVFACDLSEPDTLAPVLKEIAGKGMPDIIVNNAGAFIVAPIEETEFDVIKDAIRINLASPYVIVRAFLPAMKKRGAGDVVTIGSIADRVAYAGNTLYAATKFGARGMHEALRDETRGTGVRVSLVSPGPVDTSIWDAVDPDNKPGFTPRAKMLDAAAVADAVLWLVTRPASVNVDELRLSRA
jgi:NADP-dependent 3-hydroxy acid dehydrogenase YdfG